MSALRDRLNKNLDTFLAERRESDGGWAPVTEEDLKHLYAVVEALLEAKWGWDSDGDLPVDIRIVDRTRETMRYFFAIPHIDEDRPDMKEQALRAFELSLANLEIAASGMDKYLKLARLKSDPETEAMAEALDKALPIEPPLGHARGVPRSLDEQRQDEAEYIYENGHTAQGVWGEHYEIEDANGWETVQPGNEYWRTVFVRHEEEDDLDRPTRAFVLRITFQEGTADVKSVDFSEKGD